MARKQVRAIVRGLVQGVLFRAETRREAKRLGLVGWVRNLPNGSVELVAEGTDDSIRELIMWAKRGPSGARVDTMETSFHECSDGFPDFEVIE